MVGPLLERVRRNHALEHATVSVLLSRLGPTVRLVGRATPDGFYIYGNVPTEELTAAVQEGLARMRRGESHLAVTPLCGTNIAVAGLLAGLASVLAMGGGNRANRLPNAMTAAMLAVVAAQPLGRLVQKYVTTSPDLADVEVAEIRRGPSPEGRGGFGLGPYHKVRTRWTTSRA
ncbi:MAG TPA: DUF6391 domain-containing protein [Dehalococcoidia bacterium]